MGCTDDDTCDQPATKGEIESLQSLIAIASSVIVTLGLLNHLMLGNVQRHTNYNNRFHEGIIGIRDQQTIRKLLNESPTTRKALIRDEYARLWDKAMEEHPEWMEEQGVAHLDNPYRD